MCHTLDIGLLHVPVLPLVFVVDIELQIRLHCRVLLLYNCTVFPLNGACTDWTVISIAWTQVSTTLTFCLMTIGATSFFCLLYNPLNLYKSSQDSIANGFTLLTVLVPAGATILFSPYNVSYYLLPNIWFQYLSLSSLCSFSNTSFQVVTSSIFFECSLLTTNCFSSQSSSSTLSLVKCAIFSLSNKACADRPCTYLSIQFVSSTVLTRA